MKRPRTDYTLDDLFSFIKELYNIDEISQHIVLQISRYHKQYKYTYGGIAMSLYYFHIVKHKPIKEEYKNTLGIIPDIYDEAMGYFQEILLAQMLNEEKKKEEYEPIEKEVTILPPRRKPQKIKLFKLGDEDE